MEQILNKHHSLLYFIEVSTVDLTRIYQFSFYKIFLSTWTTFSHVMGLPQTLNLMTPFYISFDWLCREWQSLIREVTFSGILCFSCHRQCFKKEKRKIPENVTLPNKWFPLYPIPLIPGLHDQSAKELKICKSSCSEERTEFQLVSQCQMF